MSGHFLFLDLFSHAQEYIYLELTINWKYTDFFENF